MVVYESPLQVPLVIDQGFGSMERYKENMYFWARMLEPQYSRQTACFRPNMLNY